MKMLISDYEVHVVNENSCTNLELIVKLKGPQNSIYEGVSTAQPPLITLSYLFVLTILIIYLTNTFDNDYIGHGYRVSGMCASCYLNIILLSLHR